MVFAGQYGYGTSRLDVSVVFGIFEMDNGDKKIVPVKNIELENNDQTLTTTTLLLTILMPYISLADTPKTSCI